MFYKPYINYRQRMLEQNLSFENNDKEEANEKDLDPVIQVNLAVNEAESTEKPSSGDLQTGLKNKEAAIEPEQPLTHPGFEQIAPGVFQFKHPSLKEKLGVIPPVIAHPTPELWGFQLKETSAMEEAGFIRVDGLPGSFEHYKTPVYQFT